jgi:CDP-6-deoxy-D-xylo-4-hexulose-3-dehydrase
MKQQKIKERIHALIEQYFDASQKPFVPGRDVVQYAGAVYDETELNAMVDVMLNGWFGLGAQGEGLERDLETYFGAKKAYLTNSGSSADLLAIASLMSPLLSHPVLEDDEVITPLAYHQQPHDPQNPLAENANVPP